MSPLRLNGSTSGAVTLDCPAVGGNNTLVLPTGNGTANYSLVNDGSGNLSWFNGGPLFYAHNSANQSVADNVWTKLSMNVEVWDTNSNYDPTTNYRFLPTVAGWYTILGGIAAAASSGFNGADVAIFRNGSFYRGSNHGASGTLDWNQVQGLVYCNGTSDYVELYANVRGTSPFVYTNSTLTRFEGFFVRPT